MTNPIKTYQLRIFTDLNALDPENDNIDVEIIFESGERYSPTFFTLKNIETLMHRFRTTGECKSGLYFWASDMIIVQRLTEVVIRETIEGLIQSGELYKACSRLAEE